MLAKRLFFLLNDADVNQRVIRTMFHGCRRNFMKYYITRNQLWLNSVKNISQSIQWKRLLWLTGLTQLTIIHVKILRPFIWATLTLLFNSKISPHPNVLLPWVALAQMFPVISGPAVTFTVSRVTSPFICLITSNGYQTQIICSWGPICQSLSEWRTTCSHQKGAVLTPANVPIILLPLWKKWKVCLCCLGSAEVTHVSLQDHCKSPQHMSKPHTVDWTNKPMWKW